MPSRFAVPKIRSIVVPLDGSPLGERALTVAIALARVARATVHVVHVFVPLPAGTHVPGLFVSAAGLQAKLADAEMQYLRDTEERVGRVKGVRLSFDFVRVAEGKSQIRDAIPIAACLDHYTKEQSADLIVMSCHGRGGLNRAVLGSVTNRLIRDCATPVLMIRDQELAAPAGLFTHMLIPLDGSSLAEKVVPKALAVGALAGVRVTVLRVVIPQHAIARPAPVARLDAKDLARKQKEAERYLDGLLDRLPSGVVSPRMAVVAEKSPALAILRYAQTHGVDLMAMTTHGRSGVKRLTLGSVADKVLRTASTDTLIYRPRTTEASK